MLRKFLIAAAAVCSASPTLAVKPDQLEVLGVHLADGLSASTSKLIAQGFTKQPYELQKCAPSYESRMADFLRSRRTDFLPTEIACTRSFQKGDDSVQVNYLIAPRGYVVSDMEYSFRSTETSEQVESRLVAKFGSPSEHTLGDPRWYTNNSAEGNEPHLYLIGGHMLQMGGGNLMTDTFVGEVRKDLIRRMPAMRANL